MRIAILIALAASLAVPAAYGQCNSSKAQMTSTQSQCSSSCGGQLTSMTGKDIVSTAVGAGSFNTLVAAVKAAGLVETLQGPGPFTVFAPSDDAFAKISKDKLSSLLLPENKALLTSILTYHVVPGRVTADKVVKLSNAATANGQRVDIKVEKGTVMIDGAKVVTTDIECSNGVIHVIDSVIMPSTKDIVDTAVAAGSFKTLAAALKAADLIAALKAEGPYTVFAPTDDAFEKLPKGLVASLLEPKNSDKLTAILTYHVVPGRVYADKVVSLSSAKSLEGSTISIAVKDGSVMLNGSSKVIKTDIETTNGVIHVIDTVILPQADN